MTEHLTFMSFVPLEYKRDVHQAFFAGQVGKVFLVFVDGYSIGEVERF